MHVCMHVCMYGCIHRYIHTYIHTYIHSVQYTHSITPRSGLRRTRVDHERQPIEGFRSAGFAGGLEIVFYTAGCASFSPDAVTSANLGA